MRVHLFHVRRTVDKGRTGQYSGAIGTFEKKLSVKIVLERGPIKEKAVLDQEIAASRLKKGKSAQRKINRRKRGKTLGQDGGGARKQTAEDRSLGKTKAKKKKRGRPRSPRKKGGGPLPCSP